MEPFTYKEYLYYKRIIKKYKLVGVREEEEKYNYKTKNKVEKPHDKIFKKVLDNKEEVIKFLNERLALKDTPYALQEKDIEKYNREFITEDFHTMESDVIYKKNKQNIFFLIEQQSTIDYAMPYRILKYNMAIMESAIDKEKLLQKNYKLPTIYSFVIYTGNRKWNVTNYLSDKQEQLIGCEAIPFANFQLIDINHYTHRDLLKSDSLLSKMMLLEKATNRKELEKYLQIIVRQKLEIRQKIFLQNIIKYVFKSKLSKSKYEKLIDDLKLKEKGGDEAMFVELLLNQVDEFFELQEKVTKQQKQLKVQQMKIKEEKSKVKEEKSKVKEEKSKVKEQESKVKEQESKIKEQKNQIKKREVKVKKKEKELETREEQLIIKMLKNQMDEKDILITLNVDKKRLEKIKKTITG